MATYKNPVVARVEQLIRVPAPVVFAAFTDPKELKKFWLSRASAPLEEGKSVEWYFKVRGVKDELRALALERDRRISLQRLVRRHWLSSLNGFFHESTSSCFSLRVSW